MQKVEGSSPFIRSENAWKSTGSVVPTVNVRRRLARLVLAVARDDVAGRLVFVEARAITGGNRGGESAANQMNPLGNPDGEIEMLDEWVQALEGRSVPAYLSLASGVRG